MPAPQTERVRATRDARQWRVCLLFVVFFLTIIIVYIPAIQSGYIWDDDTYVTQNETLRSVEGLGRIWFEIGATKQYYPLLFTAWWVQYQVWGQYPAGYHLINVLLHACSSLLLFFIVRRLCVPGAFVVAALFALHPVHVESVAWVTELKNTLSGVFYMSSLLLYLRYAGLGDGDMATTRRWRFLGGALVFFLCALLSKTATCSLPATIFLLLWWKKKQLSFSNIAPLLPMAIVGVVLGLITAWVEREVVGAAGDVWALSFLDRLLIAGRALWFYAGKLLWPFHLTCIYEKWDINDAIGWNYLYPFLSLVPVIVLWRLRRVIGRGPLVAVLIFGGTLLPALGFIDFYFMLYSFVADRFQYLASVPLIALAVAAATVTLNWIAAFSPTRRLHPSAVSVVRPLHAACAVVVLTVFAVLTWRQAGVYRNKETLWTDTISKNPKAWVAYHNLGVCLESQGRMDESFRLYVAALDLNPDFALAHKNLGVLLMRRGGMREAETHFRQAIDNAPNYGDAYGKLGICLAQQGRTSDAIALLEKAVALTPTDATVYNNLGWILAGSKRFDEAILAYRKALALDPAYAEAYYNLGTALVSFGRFHEAISPLAHAARIKPDYADAYYNMGHAYFRLGRRQEAIDAFRAALRIDRQHAPARQALLTLGAAP